MPGHLGFHAHEPFVVLAQPVDREMRAHARQQFVRVKRLSHVVHRPKVEPAHNVAGLGFRREEDDRDVTPRRHGFDARAGLEPVHFWHHHVQQDQVRTDLTEDLQGLPAVGGDMQQVALVAQDRR